MSNPIASSAVLFALAVALIWAGTRLALSRPPGTASTGLGQASGQPDRPGRGQTLARSLGVVAGLTVTLAVLGVSSAVHVHGVSGLMLLIVISAVAGCWQITRTHLTGAAGIAAAVALGAAALAWLAWPGWATATALAVLITVQAVPLLEFGWSFASLAWAGLAVAAGYDAVQVWLTHNIMAVAQPGGPHPAWLPIMYYMPASWHLAAPPVQILGAGDVMLPAVLVVAAGRVAARAGKPVILRAAIAAYAAGLVLVFAVVAVDGGAAFPVTVITIPAVIAAVLAAASAAGVRPLLATTAPAPAPASEGGPDEQPAG